jgi:purine-binding chemotaxis protein CheW
MPIPQKPLTRSTDSGGDNSVILPDLLAGLLDNMKASASQAPSEGVALTPEVMSPEEPMPPATPVNAAMPEFLASLRTLLETQDGLPNLTGDVPAEAVQDFAHGTNELLNYLLHEVVGTDEEFHDNPPPHASEAAQDFETGTGDLLNYLLSQVMSPNYPDAEIEYPPEVMADFAAGTQDLLNQLLSMTEIREEQAEAPPTPEFTAAQYDLLNGLIETAAGAIDAEPAVESVVEPAAEAGVAAIETLPELAPSDAQNNEALDQADLARGLLDGLLANLTESNRPVFESKPSHGLGEVPPEYVDESDQEDVERPAGAFEMLLDQIDAELPPPPVARGITESAKPVEPGERFVAFELAGEAYAVPFECVLETDHIPRSTHVPGMPAHVRGVLNLRGEIIPLVDLRMLMGIDSSVSDGRMLVIRDAAGKSPVALVVDRLQGLASFQSGEIVKRVPTDGGTEFSRRVVLTAERTTVLLDPDRILAAVEGDSPPITIDFKKTDKRNGYV